MKSIISLIASIWILFYSLPLFSQTLTIDHKTQRFLGTVSDLDRSRFFTVHADANGTDPDLVNFMNDYNVSPGRQFWGPFSPQIAPGAVNGIYPAYQNGTGAVRNVSNYVGTQHPKDVIRWNIDKTTAANWVVEYFKDFSTSPPKYFEPMNEPFVHAGDAEFSAQQPDQALMRRRMAEWFGEIGKKIHADPALVNMKVIGYSSAWPSLERSNFGHWDDRMKMFMDVAGADMDAFSTHLYDGLNVTGQSNFRSGSNSEAILDLIETYSVIKWGIVKDHAITEYGGIESGYPSTYSDTKSVQSVRSINHILFNLLERENNMAISIPFITGKANWHISAQNNYQPYGAVLFRPSNLGQPNPTGWVYTPRIHFYELWKEVKGKRVHATTDNPDIQAQAFVDNNKMYIAINNLDDQNQVVKLNFIKGLGRIQSIQKKSLKIYQNQAPIFSNTFINSPKEITLEEGETVVLEYTFSQNIVFDNAIRSAKYYTNKYLQDINANSPITFAFNGLTTGTGKATLRMSIGRYHNNNSTGVSKRPVVTINGTTIATPSNWKGYDQATRSDFFGTIEIPVPMHLIQANNVVSITFPDNGGKVASAILQVEKYDNAVPDQSAYPAGVAHPVPGVVECENYDLGGQNKAYYDEDAANLGSSFSNYRITEGVDISASNTSTSTPLYAVGWTRVGEWLEYTIDVAQTGRYQADIRYAAGSPNAGQIHLAFNGEKTDLINLPRTGNWSTFNNVVETVSLSAGLQVLRVHVNSPGLDIDNISFSLLPPANESISLINPPSSIASSTSMTFEVAYGTPVSRDLVVQFWSATSWLGQSNVTVPAGQGSRNVTVNLANAPALGTGYKIKADIRPIGGNWASSLDFDNAYNITVTGNDSIHLVNPPNSILSSTSMTFNVDYEASVSRDLVVEFWSATAWLGQSTITVPAGQGSRNVTINLANAPASGSGYKIKAGIRPIGGNWTTNLDFDNAQNITVTGNDSIHLVNPPSSIFSSTSMTFDVDYEASISRDLVVEFWSPTASLGQSTVTVPAGLGSRNVTVNLANAPAPGSGYIIKSSIRPIGGNSTTNLDFDNAQNITITGNDSIHLVNPPSSILSSTSMTFDVDYEASISRDLVVEFWSATAQLGQTTLTVPAGLGNRNVTVNLANAPAPGTGYMIKSSIRPIGGNSATALDIDNAQNITVTGNDSIHLVNPPSSILSSTSMTFDVDYEASVSRDLVVEFWSATAWLGQSTVTVPAGQGNRNITINLANAPAPGSGYKIKAGIRPIGGNWTTSLDFDNAQNITVTGNDSIHLVNPPSSILSSTSMAFDVDYEASISRDLVVDFWSPTASLGQTTVTVPAGLGSRNVTVNLANAPAPGSGYIIKSSIRPIGGNSTTNLDVDNAQNITVTGNDSIHLINPPSSILSSTSMTFDVDYEASISRDLVVEFWSATAWLGQSTVTVPAGQGNRNITINLANAPAPGSGYKIKAGIRPIGGNWTTSLDFDNAQNITVTGNDSIHLVNPPSSILSSTSITFDVDYEASISRDLVVEFWSATSWLGQSTVTVPAGQGNRNITINLANAPAPGSGYLIKAGIRPIGGNWTTSLDSDNAQNITVTGNDSIHLVNPPNSITSSTSMTFDVDYEASISRDLVVEFWSATSWLGQSTVTVPAGQGNRNITINLANAPAPGSGYLIKAGIRPIGGNWTTSLDSDNAQNITVTTPQTPYSGTAHSIPGSVEAEHYDLGGEGVAYHDLSTGNTGNQLRTDHVDIQFTGDSYGTYNVGWIATDEWLEYTIDCATSANYDLYMRVASPYSTAKYKVFIDGIDKTGVIDVPNTGNWQSYQTVRTSKLAISAGTHVMRIQVISGNFNFNDWAMWIPAPSARATAPITSINESRELKIYPNPTNKEFVQVEFKGLKEKAALQIFNVQGKLVKETVLKNATSQIDLQDIHNGVYLIRITEDDYSTVKKLIIQK